MGTNIELRKPYATLYTEKLPLNILEQLKEPPMNQPLLPSLLFLLTLANTPATQAQEPASQEPVIHEEPFLLYRYTLPNGMRIWCQPRTESQSVAVQLLIGTGLINETRANNGISHFVEHMLFTGTERWSEEEVKDIITRRGGYWNGWTGSEETGYIAQVADQDIDIALDWLAEVVFHPTFPAKKVDKERKVIFQEKGGRDGLIYNTIEKIGLGYGLTSKIEEKLLPHSIVSLYIIGEDDSLDRIDRAAMLDYYNTFYVPNNAALIVVGNISPQHIYEQAIKHFGNLKPQKLPRAPAHPPVPTHGPYQVVTRGPLPNNRVKIKLAVRSVGFTHKDRWALIVLDELLSKDLMEDIRYKRGLVYGMGVDNVTFNDFGYFYISSNSDAEYQAEILHIIEEYLERIRQGNIDHATVEEAKIALKGRRALVMESNNSRAGMLSAWILLLEDHEPVPDFEQHINLVNADDLSRVVQTYFVPQQQCLGIHRPIVTYRTGAWAAGIISVLATLLGGPKIWGYMRKYWLEKYANRQ